MSTEPGPADRAMVGARNSKTGRRRVLGVLVVHLLALGLPVLTPTNAGAGPAPSGPPVTAHDVDPHSFELDANGCAGLLRSFDEKALEKARADDAAVLGDEHAAAHDAERRYDLQECRKHPNGVPAVQSSAVTASALPDPAQVGSWSPAVSSSDGVNAIHSVLLATGKVLQYGALVVGRAPDGTPNDIDTIAHLFDPATNTFKRVDPPSSVFCGGATILGDGTVLVVGGLWGYDGFTSEGNATVLRFNPWSETWTQLPDMHAGRWYPTLTELPDGSATIIGGKDITQNPNPDLEKFDVATGQMSVVGQITGGLYPQEFLLPDGTVIGVFGNRISLVDPTTWTVAYRTGPVPSQFNNAGSVLLPGAPTGSWKILLAGGRSGYNATVYPATATVHQYDAQNPAGGWVSKSPLPQIRTNMNLTIAPDGKLFGIGGNQDASEYGLPVYSALQYDPATDVWSTMASQVYRRAYHSTALLLPDGRILSGGDDGAGGGNQRVEIFSPPYLFRGARPVITSAPPVGDFGTTISIATTAPVTRAVLMAPGAVTHSNDMHQRHVELAVTPTATGLSAVLPGRTVAPPGPYMLFVLDANGVPSVASWINMGGAPNAAPTAGFTFTCSGTSCQFDGHPSVDPDGSVVRWDWTFGDGTTGSGATVSHTFADTAPRTVQLQITDDRGGTAGWGRAVSFTATCAAGPCSFTAPAASSYAWDFGDGTTAATSSPSHTYAVNGVHPVTLTVTDAQGSIGTTTLSVTSGATGPPTLASDTFARTVSPGWGAADTGGTWALSGTTPFSTNGTAGNAVISAAAGAFAASLGAGATWSDVTVKVSTDKAATGAFGHDVGVSGRRIASNKDYRARVRFQGTQVFAAASMLNGTTTEALIGSEVVVPGLPYAPGTTYSVRVQVAGTSPTTIRIKVWSTASPEPAGWLITRTDSSPLLQVAGGFGVTGFVAATSTSAPVTFTFDDFTATQVDVPPVAAFTSGCVGLSCSFDGSTSTDADGAVVGYAWDFGDGTTGSGVSPSHTYLAGGSYTVALTVTDNWGGTATASHSLTVIAPGTNLPPVAAFTSGCVGLSCSFDGSTSSDSDGSVVGYAWDFGDGATGSGVSPSHTYAAGASYTVTLTVTDDGGSTTPVSHTVTVAPVTNASPTAAFTSGCVGLSCSFDGSTSSDSDGAVVGYAWDFGDGATGSGVSPSHTYAAGGSYTVALTVTDDAGGTGAVTHVVTVAPPAPTQYAMDTFTRVQAQGWGVADQGGNWGTASSVLSVNGSTGVAVLAAGGSFVNQLNGVSVSASDTTVKVSTDKAGTGNVGHYVGVVGRRVSPTAAYRGRVRFKGNQVIAGVVMLNGSTSEALVGSEVVVPGLVYTPGTQYSVRVQVFGTNPTTINVKVWPTAAAEPTAWTVTRSDSSAALQAPGSVGLTGFVSANSTTAPVTFSFDDFVVRSVNLAPVASFTSACVNLACTFDGSASSDPDGTVQLYSWTFGDGGFATGATPAHTYGAAGTYSVVLTVTDNQGLTSQVTNTVTVA